MDIASLIIGMLVSGLVCSLAVIWFNVLNPQGKQLSTADVVRDLLRTLSDDEKEIIDRLRAGDVPPAVHAAIEQHVNHRAQIIFQQLHGELGALLTQAGLLEPRQPQAPQRPRRPKAAQGFGQAEPDRKVPNPDGMPAGQEELLEALRKERPELEAAFAADQDKRMQSFDFERLPDDA